MTAPRSPPALSAPAHRRDSRSAGAGRERSTTAEKATTSNGSAWAVLERRANPSARVAAVEPGLAPEKSGAGSTPAPAPVFHRIPASAIGETFDANAVLAASDLERSRWLDAQLARDDEAQAEHERAREFGRMSAAKWMGVRR